MMDYKTIIEEKGIKKSHVAKKIGISSTRLSQYINGRRPMPVEIEKKLTWFLMEIK